MSNRNTRQCIVDCGLIYLTPVSEADIDLCCTWVNDPEAMELISLQKQVTHDEERAWLLEQGDSKQSFMVMLKSQQQDDLPIGIVAAFNIQPTHGTCELEIWIGAKNLRGNGYGTQVTRALASYLFEQCGLRKITSHVIASNKRSAQCMEKSGFVLEATLKDHVLINGTLQDLLYFACFKPS